MSDKRLTLIQTCGACPEQYDVKDGDRTVGYMRLRHGHFYALHNGMTVYEAHPKGDGVFEPDERVGFLNAACRAIMAALEEDAVEEPIYDLGYEENGGT